MLSNSFWGSVLVSVNFILSEHDSASCVQIKSLLADVVYLYMGNDVLLLPFSTVGSVAVSLPVLQLLVDGVLLALSVAIGSNTPTAHQRLLGSFRIGELFKANFLKLMCNVQGSVALTIIYTWHVKRYLDYISSARMGVGVSCDDGRISYNFLFIVE